MEELLEKLADILEVEEVDVNKKFTDYEEWDSLCGLSVIAMLDSDYKMTMKNKDILEFKTIKDFCETVINK